MMYVDETSCTGCGACVASCPTEAIHLEGNVAAIEQDLCTDCQACLEICAEKAILSVSEMERERTSLPATRPEQEVIHVQVPQAPTPIAAEVRPARWQEAIVPAVTGALAFVGRELPRILPAVLDFLDRRPSMPPPASRSSSQNSVSGGGKQGGRGRQQRRRRRGG